MVLRGRTALFYSNVPEKDGPFGGCYCGIGLEADANRAGEFEHVTGPMQEGQAEWEEGSSPRRAFGNQGIPPP